MNQPNSLALAIRNVIAEMQPATTIADEELRTLATHAKNFNEEALTFLSNLPPVKSENNYLALQLIRASFDHGRGLLYLLESNPKDMGGPALALHRSQIENFLRGVFLGFIAIPEQVEDFLENDFGVREKNHNGKWQNISVASLAKHVEGLINNLTNGQVKHITKLSSMVENAWSPLCGFVHGGKAIHSFYMDGQGQIGGDIPIEGLVQCVNNCFAITNFAFLVVIARIYGLEKIPIESPLHNAMDGFIRYRAAICSK